MGGLGRIGARAAVLAGADVDVAEINEEVRPLATEIGATDVRASIRDFPDVEFDVIVDYAGFGVTTADTIASVKLGGRVVQVGMGKPEATISAKGMILVHRLQRRHARRHRGAVRADGRGRVGARAHGDHVRRDPGRPQRLHRGDVTGRLVAIYE